MAQIGFKRVATALLTVAAALMATAVSAGDIKLKKVLDDTSKGSRRLTQHDANALGWRAAPAAYPGGGNAAAGQWDDSGPAGAQDAR
ncbi:MAG: hypothetical protein MRY74_03760 [Neomegalonema sp.]|nr:hypothetical protein [Neomegalonema sp.]